MNGKKKLCILLLSPLLSPAVYHHVLFFPSCCFAPHSPLFFLTFIYPSLSSATLFTSSWKSTPPLFMHSSPSIPLLLPTHLFLYPSHLSIFPSPHLSQYFDEEQDDHEYPYYYEETTGVPSSSASPSPQPGAPNQQVKREQERRKTRAEFVEGKENERERYCINVKGIIHNIGLTC